MGGRFGLEDGERLWVVGIGGVLLDGLFGGGEVGLVSGGAVGGKGGDG